MKGTDFEEGLCDITHVKLTPVENRHPEFTSRPLHLASLKNNGESGHFDLRTIVRDEKPESLRFKAIDIPDWVKIEESGVIEINPNSQALPLGKTLLKFAAVDEEGLQNVLFTRVAIHQAGVLTLPATDAQLSQGKQIRFTGNMITHIIQDDATAVWEFRPEVSGRYDVFLYSGSPDENTGKVTINDQTQEFAVTNTGDYRSVQKMNVGQFQLMEGELTQLTLGVVKRVDGLCDVSHLRLVPVANEQIQN